MVVIAIIVVITIAVLPAVLHALEDRKFSESARSIQAAFAAARDRAIVSGQIRGLRLVRDDTDQWEVSSLVYIGVPEPYTVGTVSVAAGSHTVNAAPMSPNPYWNQADPVTGTERVPGALAGLDTKPGVAGIDDDGDGMLDNATELGWAGSDDVVQSHIRFNNTGRLYAIRSVTSATSLELVATEPAPPAYSGVPYQIYLPPVPLPNVQAVKLPDGVVIDVRGLSVPAPNNFPRSRYIPTQDLVTGNMDILFGPDGFVTGPAAAQPFVHFWVGARADKIATRVHDLVTLNTRTGSVHVYGNPDPNAPSPYAPAERALGVSILDVP